MGETLLKGYLQIKCANPGRIVRKVCHFSKTSSCSDQSFGDGASPPKTWGSPSLFLTEKSAGLAKEVVGGGVPHV